MSDQSKLGIGKIITIDQQRDAIHVAVAPVVTGERTYPGAHVGFLQDGTVAEMGRESIGVIDPFLREPRIAKGERVWLLLYPGSITSLRHDWTHPAFEPGRISIDDHVSKSREWIEQHAHTLGLTGDVVMENAETWLQCQDYTVQRDSERWRDNFNPIEFWHHYEVVTGKPVPEAKKQSFYCCTC